MKDFSDGVGTTICLLFCFAAILIVGVCLGSKTLWVPGHPDCAEIGDKIYCETHFVKLK